MPNSLAAPAALAARPSSMAMNITQVSNNKNIDFGITACRRSVPHAQRMIDYLEEALVELEQAVGIKKGK